MDTTMKTNLSHILPVWKACRILGEPTVRRVMENLIQFRTRGSNGGSLLHHHQSDHNHQEGDDDATRRGTTTPHPHQLQSQQDLEQQELEQLMDALFYIPNQLPHGATRDSSPPVPTPPVIAQAWKKLTTNKRLFGLDKALLFRFVVPHVSQPHSGPQGHMGLFDCFIYTLQGHATTSASTYYGGANTSGLIWIPDVLIFWAVCKEYHDHCLVRTSLASSLLDQDDADEGQRGGAKSESEGETDDDDDEDEDDPETRREEQLKKKQHAITCMAKLAFRFYDSYQKRGTIARDTIHRFLTDVHGEDSYKTVPMRMLLDGMYQVDSQSQLSVGAQQDGAALTPQGLLASLSDTQFVRRILESSPSVDANRTVIKPHASPEQQPFHILVDWMAQLGMAMMPLPELSPSTCAYLETIETSHRPICAWYQLAERRLYEIKRRFHSLVESSAIVIQGDPMAEEETDESVAAETAKVAAPTVPKHVITQRAFEKAVTLPNDDMGQGAYLPLSLAQLVFTSAITPNGMVGSADDSMTNYGRHDDYYEDEEEQQPKYWGLFDVLKFGCEAVRCKKAHNPPPPSPASSGKKVSKEKQRQEQLRHIRERDAPLMRRLFDMFTHTPKQQGNSSSGSGRRVLDRRQIGNMLLLLLEHSKFRLEQDSTPKKPGDGSERGDSSHGGDEPAIIEAAETNGAGDESKMVIASACAFLGLLPSTDDDEKPPAPTEKVSLKMLVDNVLEEAKDNDCDKKDQSIGFDEFCSWHYGDKYSEAEDDPAKSQTHMRRLGPLILDLRLIATVLFGIPPTMASLEVMLIAEIQRRHRYRYPPTDVSRRGPKGTVWYIIDNSWFQSWAALVKAVSHTPDDGQDGRGDTVTTSNSNANTSRGMLKINNTKLLAENGSLALRADIRWGHDYEILPPLAWSALQAWYDGGPPIHRTVVKYVPASSASPHSKKPQPRIRTEHEMELYPFFVTVFLCDAVTRGEPRPFQQYVPVSRVSPVRVVLLQLAKGLNVDPDMCRLWVMGFPGNDESSEEADQDWLLNLDMNIVDQRNKRKETVPPSPTSGASDSGGIVLLLELKDEETKMWPRGTDGKRRSFLEARGGQVADAEMGDGVVGLYNMGNTCYLNSSIQVISHTPIFSEYFTSKAYLNDINTTNPLGQQGRLAQVSAVLINSLWKRFNQMGAMSPSAVYSSHQHKRIIAPGSYFPVNAPSLTPKTFKESLGKFSEHFQGNEQHDAQELLAFLLGGLSEDLNRIVDKPYIEAPDSDGRPDAELADIWWTNHLKREMSIIVALFTGQFKSLLTCRSCKYESARFEPFTFLQLPLPEDDHIVATIIYYPLNKGGAGKNGKSEPIKDVMKYSVRVQNNGHLHDVLVALAKVLHADESSGGSGPEASIERYQQLQRLASMDSEEADALEKVYQQRAKDMAVVDMREGYIAKVAATTWALADLQNKDTGDLPVLHVYELDPLPAEETATAAELGTGNLGNDHDEIKPKKVIESNDKGEGGESGSEHSDEESEDNEDRAPESAPAPPKYSFLALAQRRSEVVVREYMHPLAHRVFGTPLLLRVVDLEGYTGRGLYDMVAKRLRNVVPKSALRFLEQDNSSAFDDGESSSQNPSDSGKQPTKGTQRLTKTTTDMDEVSAGPVPRYGFRLRVTTRDGRRCTLCPWYECCIGCLIPDDEHPTIVMCGDSIAVDWHFAVDVATSGFGQRLNSQLDSVITSSGPMPKRAPSGAVVKNHHSMGTGPKKKGVAGSISLEDCLDAFAKEEKIPEAYCSRCKDFRVQTKRMSLWRLPPVVIIHLKRFQFTPQMRRKLRDLVLFPLEGLDLSRIVASDPLESVDSGGAIHPAADKKDQKSNGEAPAESNIFLEDPNRGGSSDNDDDSSTAEETETTGDPMTATDDGRSVMLYDLYGVVHHQGALSGGHYVASLKSEIDGRWRLFNDAQVYEIHSRDVVDSSAYILFYIRRDVKGARLSDFWDSSSNAEAMTEEDMDNFLRGGPKGSASERCVIS